MHETIKKLVLSGVLAATLIGTLPTKSQAALVGFNIDWTGRNGRTMTGMFSYDDSNTGIIDETALESFMIEGFAGSILIGSFTADTTQPDFGQVQSADPFNFNFDTTNEIFLVGGDSDGGQGQSWNASEVEFGFFSNTGLQGFTGSEQETFNSIILGVCRI